MENTPEEKQPNTTIAKENYSLVDVLFIFVAFVTISSCILLAKNIFKSDTALILGLCSTMITLILFRPKITFFDKRFTPLTVLVIALSLIFVLPPGLYVTGGQDQGTYVNISKQYDLQGRLYTNDRFRASLTKPQQFLYDIKDSFMMPSFEKWNRPNSEYSMAFYPAHPAWMSIVGYVFGGDNRAYSITLFSILSLLAIYLLTYELGRGNRVSAFLATLFFAVNPLHVFFSKITLGEMQAAALVLAAYYFLAKYYNSQQTKFIDGYFSLFISTLLFMGFMFTRMTFLVYLPFLMFLGFCITMQAKTITRKLHILMYLSSLSLMFAYSNRYYFRYLNSLYLEVNNWHIEKYTKFLADIIGKEGFGYFYLGVVGAVVIFVMSVLSPKKAILAKITQVFITNWHKIIAIICGFIFIALLIHSCILGYRLGFIGSQPFERFGISKLGFASFFYTELFASINYISLFVFGLAMLAVFYLCTKKITSVWVPLLFGLIFIFVCSSINDYVRYNFYYSRYYLTEVVPALIIVSGLVLGYLYQAKHQKLVLVLTILILATTLPFSLFQLNRTEGPDNAFYNRVNQVVTSNDLLIFVNQEAEKYAGTRSSTFNYYVFAPFKYYYGHKTFVLSDYRDLANPLVSELIFKFKHVYVLSNNRLAIRTNYQEIPKIVSFSYSFFSMPQGCGTHLYEFLHIDKAYSLPVSAFLNCSTLPNTYYLRNRDFYLHKLR
jgi:hypothetical protein